jgi:phosphoglycerate dehydrogenase-like enzyme
MGTDSVLAANPRVAMGPQPTQWVVEAIRAGGGEPVAITEMPSALMWTETGTAKELSSLLNAHPEIEWVQLPFAGVEKVFEAGIIDRRRKWTSAKGAYAEPVAEHAIALSLAGLRLLPERARANSWGRSAGQSLFDQSVTIVGAGGITNALMKLLAPFRVKVTVVRRRPEQIDGAFRTVTTDQLSLALNGAKVVVLALALTQTSRHLIGRDELSAMDCDAWLVNVARGGLVDTNALVDALLSKSIGGAALDVTEPEPLPTGHPLWKIENCLITPHTADTTEMIRPLLARRIMENVRRFSVGRELEGLLDPDLGY